MPIIYEDTAAVNGKMPAVCMDLVFIKSSSDTILLSQAEDRAPLESDPSADLEAGISVGSHLPAFS